MERTGPPVSDSDKLGFEMGDQPFILTIRLQVRALKIDIINKEFTA